VINLYLNKKLCSINVKDTPLSIDILLEKKILITNRKQFIPINILISNSFIEFSKLKITTPKDLEILVDEPINFQLKNNSSFFKN
jgi:hypothetical protein